MLSSLWKLSAYFWKSDATEDDKTGSANKAISGPETINFEGKVTSILPKYGMINGNIFFEFSSVYGSSRPSVGDEVQGTAHRDHSEAGWIADRVHLFSEPSWDSNVNDTQAHKRSTSSKNVFTDTRTRDAQCETASNTCKGFVEKNAEDRPSGADPLVLDDNLQESTGVDSECSVVKSKDVVARVTEIENGAETGWLNYDIIFQIADCTGFGARGPHCGDWVTATVVTDVESERRLGTAIAPLRERTFSGKITWLRQTYGRIDNDVGFDLSAAENGYRPRIGDHVTGVAIESKRGQLRWRAISLKLKGAQTSEVGRSNLPTIQVSPTQHSFLAELLKDKDGVKVTSPLDFGVIDLGSKVYLTAWVRNTGKQSCNLLRVRAASATQEQLAISQPTILLEKTKQTFVPKLGEPLPLRPMQSCYVNITCTGIIVGKNTQLVLFEFPNFKIGRHVRVCVRDPNERSVDAFAPFDKRAWRNPREAQLKLLNSVSGWVVPGEKPVRLKRPTQLPSRLPLFPLPSDLQEAVLHRKDIQALRPCLQEQLDMSNYVERFGSLLFLEEIQMEIEMREFDLDRVFMRPMGEYLALPVPGLAEGRPSLMVGDRVLLTIPGEEEQGPVHEGYIHEVLSEEVLLKFNPEFHSRFDGKDYNVAFMFNRTPLRRFHQATRFSSNLGVQVLFPNQLEVQLPQYLAATPRKQSLKSGSGKSLSPAIRTKPGFEFFNDCLNSRQKAAVIRILGGQSRPTPYIVFGPPGTGKTITVVEAILQVLRRLPSSRILACTPSNSAADLIAQRLHESGLVKVSDMARLNAFYRTSDSYPACIQPYCSRGEEEDLFEVVHHRIVVCTCNTCGLLYKLSLPGDHFTHVFVDEAGQATEPECLIPISMAAQSGGQVVLAGDPMQLGPVLRSRYAKTLGLELSLLERLCDRKLYCRDESKFSDHGAYDPLLVTKLVNNYRSHPALLNLPSRTFYSAELRPCAEKEMRESLCDWPLLPNQTGFPMCFHGVRGQDLREGNSPSWFNPVEVVQVVKYLKALLHSPTHPVKADDIGVITPYRKQVEKIRLLMNTFELDEVKVGSVEEFQGQERLVIIVSTVRSTEQHVGFDLKHNLGFLSNRKRFNVTITRAKALLIFIGNPHVLIQDSYWRSLLTYAIEHRAYVGCDLPYCLQDIEPDLMAEAAAWREHTSGDDDGNSSSEDSLSETDDDDDRRLDVIVEDSESEAYVE